MWSAPSCASQWVICARPLPGGWSPTARAGRTIGRKLWTTASLSCTDPRDRPLKYTLFQAESPPSFCYTLLTTPPGWLRQNASSLYEGEPKLNGIARSGAGITFPAPPFLCPCRCTVLPLMPLRFPTISMDSLPSLSSPATP